MKHLTASLAFCTALLCAVAVNAARIAPWTPGGDVCFLVPSDGSERLVRVSSGECDSFSWSATGEVLSASNAVARDMTFQNSVPWILIRNVSRGTP